MKVKKSPVNKETAVIQELITLVQDLIYQHGTYTTSLLIQRTQPQRGCGRGGIGEKSI